MLLADMGAEVIRVDRPGGGLFGSERTELDFLNRGKRALCADLKNPDGVALVLQLIATADGLLEGFRPGVAEKLGIGPDICLQRNQRLVYGRMTGWGQDEDRRRSLEARFDHHMVKPLDLAALKKLLAGLQSLPG
jgi:alpha-methylacyl-CoA racemase